MIQFQFSKRLQAILPLENYNLILNEQSRQKKNTHSLNVINFEEFEPLWKLELISIQDHEHSIPPIKIEATHLASYNQQTIIREKSVFFHKFSLPVHDKDNKNNMDLEFEIHGIKKNSQYRDSLQRLISNGQDRVKRQNSSVHSSDSNNSQSLIGSVCSAMSLQQPLSPKSVIPNLKNSIFQPHINKTFDIQPKIRTNLYLKNSQHKFIKPINRILNSRLQMSNSLPPIQYKKQAMLYHMKTVV